MAYRYSHQQRIDWIKLHNPNYPNQHWHSDIVYRPDEILHKEFFYRKRTVKKKINPANICGIEYAYSYNCPAYKAKDWTYHWDDLLRDLKRLDWVIDNLVDLDQIIDHIHFNEEEKTVEQYGDHFFTTGGQHRLCLAKYLELDEVEVNVEEYIFDRERFQREKRFERYIPKFIEEGFLGQWYENNPCVDFVGIDVKGFDNKKDTVFIKKKFAGYVLDRMSELRRFPYRGISNSIKSMKIESNKRNSIVSDQELYLLDTLLLRHNRSILSKIFI